MDLELSECRSCGASIVWCVTRHGKNMPVDAEPNPEADFVLVDDSARARPGVPFVRKADALLDHGRDRYSSHFATCPDGDSWRKRTDRPVTCSSCANKFLDRKGKCPKCGSPTRKR